MKDNSNKLIYLYSIYQYFYDVKRLISFNVEALSDNIHLKGVLDYIDEVILDIKTNKDKDFTFTSIENRIVNDIKDELYILVDMVNGKFKKDYEFNKTAITEKVFKIETPEMEKILKQMNDAVSKNQSNEIAVPFLNNKQVEDLCDKNYIYASCVDDNQKVISVFVSQKAYNYFEIKDRYIKYGMK